MQMKIRMQRIEVPGSDKRPRAPLPLHPKHRRIVVWGLEPRDWTIRLPGSCVKESVVEEVSGRKSDVLAESEQTR